MNALRWIYIRTSDFTHGFQNAPASRFLRFYRFWASFYDVSVKLDPAYCRNLRRMVERVVQPGDVTLDIGCGTGLGTIYAAAIADKVVGIDPSGAMLRRLRKKIRRLRTGNVEVREGFFPEAVSIDERFGSVISSFMLAHLNAEQRRAVIGAAENLLVAGGRIGLFSARGEVASTFEKREEIESDLAEAGFEEIAIEDVDDIYRISTARKG